LQALTSDNATYAKLVLATGHRYKFKDADLSSIYDVDTDASAMAELTAVKEAAEISMGTDITDQDVMNIQSLADQVISMTEYRAQLYEYLKNRMNAIAPNLTILTGELVGARLIAHAGSLINLAKQPASTVQILGAEKALFRALKTKHDTPKYGLIYHASLVGQAAPKNKGKISRVLAAKASLAIRVDALSDDVTGDDEIDKTIGYEGRAKVEARLRQLDGTTMNAVARNGSNMKAQKTAKYDPVVAKVAASNVAYNTASDIVQLENPTKTTVEDNQHDDDHKKKEKKMKKEKKRKSRSDDADDGHPRTDETAPVNDAAVESAAVDISPPPKKKHKESSDETKDKSAKKSSKKAKKEKRKSQE
jgi:nucleolar protein 58